MQVEAPGIESTAASAFCAESPGAEDALHLSFSAHHCLPLGPHLL